MSRVYDSALTQLNVDMAYKILRQETVTRSQFKHVCQVHEEVRDLENTIEDRLRSQRRTPAKLEARGCRLQWKIKSSWRSVAFAIISSIRSSFGPVDSQAREADRLNPVGAYESKVMEAVSEVLALAEKIKGARVAPQENKLLPGNLKDRIATAKSLVASTPISQSLGPKTSGDCPTKASRSESE